jgi:hypothetical protein
MRQISFLVALLLLSSCSFKSPDSARVTVRMAGPEAPPLQALGFLSPGKMFGTTATPPSTVGGFDCLAVNVMGDGIPPTPHTCGCTGSNCTCGNDAATAYANLPNNIAGKTFCAYPGVTSVPQPVPSSTASETVSLAVPTGPQRIVEIVGIMDPTHVVCANPVPVGSSDDGGNSNYFELGRAIVDLFHSQAIAVPDTFDTLTPADQLAHQVNCGGGGNSYANAVMGNPALVVYYPLNETSGNTANYAPGGSVFPQLTETGTTAGTAGPLKDSNDSGDNFALLYSTGTGQALGLTTASLSLGSVSVEAWVNIPVGGSCGTSAGIFQLIKGALNVQLNCAGSGTLTFSLSDGTNTASITPSATTIIDGNWHHIVGSWVAGGNHAPSLYMDGVDKTPTASTTPAAVGTIVFPVSTQVIVGLGANSLPIGSAVAQVALYSAALSLGEEQSDYSSAGY